MRSPFDGASRRPIRLAIAAVVAADLIALSIALAGARPSALSHPFAPDLLLALGSRPLFIAPIAAVGLSAVGLFARRPGRIAAGLVALAALAILCESHAALLVGPMRVFFTSGAVLLGWIAGVAFARRLTFDDARAEELGDIGAAAALAATYVGAGASKLFSSGLSWADANTLRAIVLTQRGLSGRSPFDIYADAVIASPALAWTLSALTLAIQVGAVFYPWSPRLRAVCGALLLAFHLNVWILTPIFFPQAMALILALSFPWPRIASRVRGRLRDRDLDHSRGRDRDPERDREIVGRPPAAAIRSAAIRAGAIVLAAIVVAAAPPLRAYTRLHHRREPSAEADREKPAAADARALVRGITEGGDLAGFRVEAITGPRERAIEIHLSRGPVSLTLAITRRGARASPPPKSSARYDLFYDRVRPGASSLAPSERDRALEALATLLATTEEAAAVPAGL